MDTGECVSTILSQAQEVLTGICKEEELSLREAALRSDLRKVRHSVAASYHSAAILCSELILGVADHITLLYEASGAIRIVLLPRTTQFL